jgi:hypothetical protein
MLGEEGLGICGNGVDGGRFFILNDRFGWLGKRRGNVRVLRSDSDTRVLERRRGVRLGGSDWSSRV